MFFWGHIQTWHDETEILVSDQIQSLLGVVGNTDDDAGNDRPHIAEFKYVPEVKIFF